MIVEKKSDLNIYKERAQEEEEGSYCEPKEKATCCETGEFGSEEKEKVERVKGIDFNEWVSKLYRFSAAPNLAKCSFARLVQHLRCQTLRIPGLSHRHGIKFRNGEPPISLDLLFSITQKS